jgi:hypothetical protein
MKGILRNTNNFDLGIKYSRNAFNLEKSNLKLMYLNKKSFFKLFKSKNPISKENKNENQKEEKKEDDDSEASTRSNPEKNEEEIKKLMNKPVLAQMEVNL